MGLLVKFEELTKISKEFYDIFNPENGNDTPSHYKLREDLAKYVEEALYNHDVTEHDCKLTYKEWGIKRGIVMKRS